MVANQIGFGFFKCCNKWLFIPYTMVLSLSQVSDILCSLSIENHSWCWVNYNYDCWFCFWIHFLLLQDWN